MKKTESKYARATKHGMAGKVDKVKNDVEKEAKKIEQKVDKKMRLIDRALAVIPRIISSRVSVFFFIFLFAYLVIYSLVCFFVPTLNEFMPDSQVQSILGNYVDVLSAMGAAIAAGSGVAIHSHISDMNKSHADFRSTLDKRHDELAKSVEDLHKKLDRLQKELNKEK